MRAVVGRIHDERVVGDAGFVEKVERLADVLVMVDHRVVIGRLPASRLAQALGLGMREGVHVGEVEPDEERLAGVVRLLHEFLGARDEIVVAGFHALPGERAGILDLLLADPAPARLDGRIVRVRREGVHDAARAERLLEVRELLLVGIVVRFRLFLGVEVVEIAVELVEAVVGRQHRVEIAEVVLAELAGRVALVLERRGDGDDLLVHADRRAGNADLGQAGAIDALPGDEGRAARGAGLFAVGIGEHHAFLGDAVDVGRLIAHQAVRIAAQVRDADVVAPDDEDIRLVCFRLV